MRGRTGPARASGRRPLDPNPPVPTHPRGGAWRDSRVLAKSLGTLVGYPGPNEGASPHGHGALASGRGQELGRFHDQRRAPDVGEREVSGLGNAWVFLSVEVSSTSICRPSFVITVLIFRSTVPIDEASESHRRRRARGSCSDEPLHHLRRDSRDDRRGLARLPVAGGAAHQANWDAYCSSLPAKPGGVSRSLTGMIPLALGSNTEGGHLGRRNLPR